MEGGHAGEVDVGRNILLSKIAFLVFFGVYSAVSPFYGVFLSDRGFGPSVVGLLLAVLPLGTLLLLPPLSYLADRFHWNIHIMIAASLVAGSCICLSALFTSDGADNSRTAMGLTAACLVVHAVASVPIAPFLDHHTMSLLPVTRKQDWGSVRVFGAYGWGVGAVIFSLLIGEYGYLLAFFSYFVGILAVCLIVTNTHVLRPEPTELKFVEVVRFVTKPRRRRVLLLLCAASLMGVGYSIIGTFLFIFLTRDLGAPQLLLGLSVAFTVSIEIPIFRYSAQIHARFTDQQMMLSAMVGWAIRVIGYSLLPSAWWVLLLEPLHGFTFGMKWLAGVHTVTKAFPSHLTASAFGLLHALVFGAGPAIGMVIGGIGFDALGARRFFLVSGIIMLAGGAVFLVLDRYVESSLAFHDATSDAEERMSDDQRRDERENDTEQAAAEELKTMNQARTTPEGSFGTLTPGGTSPTLLATRMAKLPSEDARVAATGEVLCEEHMEVIALGGHTL